MWRRRPCLHTPPLQVDTMKRTGFAADNNAFAILLLERLASLEAALLDGGGCANATRGPSLPAATAVAPTSAFPYFPLPGTTCLTSFGVMSGASSEPTPIASDVSVSSLV